VAHAAIEVRCHYIDLADGRQFVAGISSLNAQALAAGVSVISGASSVPALSSAVVDRYLPRFARLDAIRMGISSGARAPGQGIPVALMSQVIINALGEALAERAARPHFARGVTRVSAPASRPVRGYAAALTLRAAARSKAPSAAGSAPRSHHGSRPACRDGSRRASRA
jgi:hypothetical protein